MERFVAEAIRVGKEKHPPSSDKTIQYGTAGFRTKACDLDHVIYRMGLLAVLRARVKKAVIGVMITASHNPEEDNGVKLVDPLGEMLEAAWEQHASRLANVKDDELGQCLLDLAKLVGAENASGAEKIVFARDTRPSSMPLSVALQDGIVALGGKFENYKLLTTPQLHYMVRCLNTANAYGEPTEAGYYAKLGAAFNELRTGVASSGGYVENLMVDCANGVGADKLRQQLTHLHGLKVAICNDGKEGKLNFQCGADFVKIQQRSPEGMPVTVGDRCASFDGDADRIVFYYTEKDGRFQLMDGDKIATLVAGYIKDLLSTSGLVLNMGLVQTAYANGSSTKYITETLKVPVVCVTTGVKHLHHKATEYDVGVYFEANGHGTVLFSDSATEKVVRAAADSSLSASQQAAAQKLKALVNLINQTVGDAISDMLLVETILHARGWSIADWNTAYKDLPNRQLKVKVKDRTVIQTTDAERQTTAPPGLQSAIDKLVQTVTNGRAFVRPSGTEDVVRVYAEANTQENTDKLAHDVSVLVYDLAGESVDDLDRLVTFAYTSST